MNHLKNLSKLICLLVLISSHQIADTDIFDEIEMVRPRYKDRVTPDYPKIAKQAQMEGTVILQAIIDVNGIPTDIVALTNLHINDRVIRGGSWNSDVWNVRSTNRSNLSPKNTSSDVGFRCVRPVTPLKRE